MKTLLEYLIRYLDFLYLDPSYRFADSRSSGNAQINASLLIVGPKLKWYVANDRGQIVLSVAPASSDRREHWFWTSLLQQYLDQTEELSTLLNESSAAWVRTNLGRVEGLLGGEQAPGACAELVRLRRANAEARWGPIPRRPNSVG